jgi:hypothetical protein
MSQIISRHLDTRELSAEALRVLEAMVAIGRAHPEVEELRIPMSAFCEAAGLPQGIEPEQLWKILLKVRRTLLDIRAIETDNPDDEDSPWASIPVLGIVSILGAQVCFTLNRYFLGNDSLEVFPSKLQLPHST